MLIDLKIQGVQLPGRSGVWDGVIANGHIVDLAPVGLAPTDGAHFFEEWGLGVRD